MGEERAKLLEVEKFVAYQTCSNGDGTATYTGDGFCLRHKSFDACNRCQTLATIRELLSADGPGDGPTIEQLAKEQGVEPLTDVSKLGGVFESEQEVDEFLRADGPTDSERLVINAAKAMHTARQAYLDATGAVASLETEEAYEIAKEDLCQAVAKLNNAMAQWPAGERG